MLFMTFYKVGGGSWAHLLQFQFPW